MLNWVKGFAEVREMRTFAAENATGEKSGGREWINLAACNHLKKC